MRTTSELEWIAEVWAANSLRNLAVKEVYNSDKLSPEEKAFMTYHLIEQANKMYPIGRYSQRGNLSELIAFSDKLATE